MIQTVTLIGSGNIAHWMAYAMHKAGIAVKQVYSRQKIHAEALACKYGAEAIDSVSQLKPGSDFYLFVIKDDAFGSLLPQLPFRLPFAAHTGGSLSIHILKEYAEKYGILYPYQSLSKNMCLDGITVPLSVEGNVPEAEQALLALAQRLSAQTAVIPEAQRQVLHRAAVFGCNFTNAMYNIAYDILTENGIDWQMIMPLLQNTLDKVKTMNPREAQTGPAKRGDSNVIRMHENALTDPRLKEMYRMITDYIRNK